MSWRCGAMTASTTRAEQAQGDAGRSALAGLPQARRRADRHPEHAHPHARLLLAAAMSAAQPSPRRAFAVATPDGAVLQASAEGEGPALLLVSGLGGTAGFWDANATTLARSFRVIRFDQRGIGASTRGTAPCTIDQLALDCLAVLDAAGHRTGGAARPFHRRLHRPGAGADRAAAARRADPQRDLAEAEPLHGRAVRARGAPSSTAEPAGLCRDRRR